MGIKYIVQGALCTCNFGSSTDELVVNTQNTLYLNDRKGEKKLAVTTTDTGATFKNNCFGSCAKKPHRAPCTAVVTRWSGEEIQKVDGAGNLLTEQSKASCPLGGQDCISIVHHGQQAELSEQHIQNSSEEIHSQINPWVDLQELEKEEKIITLKAR